MRLRRAWTGLKTACTQAHPLGGPWPAPPKGGSLAKSPLPVFGLYACQYTQSPHLQSRACVQTSLHDTAPRPFRGPEGAECGARSIPRARPSKMGGAFFSPVPFRVWATKKYSRKPCKYRRNELPPMESIGKRKSWVEYQWTPIQSKGYHDRSG